MPCLLLLPSFLWESKYIHSPVFDSFVPLQCVPFFCQECMNDPEPMETALSCLLCPYSSLSPGRWFCLWTSSLTYLLTLSLHFCHICHLSFRCSCLWVPGCYSVLGWIVQTSTPESGQGFSPSLHCSPQTQSTSLFCEYFVFCTSL